MRRWIAVCLVIILGLANIPVFSEDSNNVPCPIKADFDINSHMGNHFTLNKGQIPDSDVIFHSDNAYFTPTGIIFRVLGKTEPALQGVDLADASPPYESPDSQVQMSVFKIEFVGANPIVPVGLDDMGYKSNYFIGNDSSRWASNVPNYKTILYENIYDKINLEYRAAPDGIKYEFTVQPGGDVNDIQMKYNGADVSTDGRNIFIQTPAGLIVDKDLFAFQPINNKIIPVQSRIVLEGQTISFEAEYDRNEPIVFDPFIYSTYLGGGDQDGLFSLALDVDNNAYVSGNTSSYNFPIVPGSYKTTLGNTYDAFVSKLNNDGSNLIYSTFVGGSGWEMGQSIVIDDLYNTYIGLETNSTDFPTTPSAFCSTLSGGGDFIILKLNVDGSAILISTYIGGSKNEDHISLQIDTLGNVYVSGTSYSIDFPTVPGGIGDLPNYHTGGFVLRLNSSGSKLDFSTFICTNTSIFDIVRDVDGNIYITGVTGLNIYPVTSDAFDSHIDGPTDGFITKLN